MEINSNTISTLLIAHVLYFIAMISSDENLFSHALLFVLKLDYYCLIIIHSFCQFISLLHKYLIPPTTKNKESETFSYHRFSNKISIYVNTILNDNLMSFYNDATLVILTLLPKVCAIPDIFYLNGN